jgi:hypothetical protein
MTLPNEREQRQKHTSCIKKLINPVAIIGFPIHTYHATHCCSSHESEEKSVPAYSSVSTSGIVEL